MKICYLFSNFHLSHLTAQPGIALRLAKRVAKREATVSIISNHEVETKEFKKDGINFFLVNGVGDLKTYLLNLPKIINYLGRIKPDIIHAHGGLLMIYVWFINRFFGISMVCSLCETLEIMNSFYRRLFLFCLSRIEKIFVSCEYIKNQLLKNGALPNRILVVRIGVDEKYLVKPRHLKPDTDILYFGDSRRRRGFDIIFRLAQKLPYLKFKILLRWKDKDCSYQLEQIKKLNNVVVRHYPYSQNLKEMILKSKLVILPYRWLGVRPPLSLLESMALAKCVVTSSMAGNEEVVKNGNNGLIINFDNLNDGVSKISFLIKNDRARENLGRKARKTIKQMYSSEEYHKILSYYGDLLKGRNR